MRCHILHLPFPLLLCLSIANSIRVASGSNLLLVYIGCRESKYSNPSLLVAPVELGLSCHRAAKRNTVISGKQTYLHVILVLVYTVIAVCLFHRLGHKRSA